MLIFLDIDGVMIPAKDRKAPELLADGFPAFSSKACYALNSIITPTTTVLLTTSHKANFTIEEWKGIFKNRGVKVQNLFSLPTNTKNLSRKEEIVNWFNVNIAQDEFIIIDDDKSLNDLPEFLKRQLIQTSPYIGLTEEHVTIVNAIFSREEHLLH